VCSWGVITHAERLPEDALALSRHDRDGGADGRPGVAAMEDEQHFSTIELCNKSIAINLTVVQAIYKVHS